MEKMEKTEKRRDQVAWEHLDVIRTIGKERGWSRQKIKSIRGQILALPDYRSREEYLQKLIRRNRRHV